MSDPATAAPEPPFYRGEKGEWDAPWCDRIIESGNACDAELRDMALGAIGTTARDRLKHKADGVRLALSYVEEAIRAH